jgi:hypothetical protein
MTMMRKLKKAIPYDSDDVLAALGLEARRSGIQVALTGLALLSLGTLVGVGLGLLMAPKPGIELRADLVKKLKTAQAKRNGVLPETGLEGETVQISD